LAGRLSVTTPPVSGLAWRTTVFAFPSLLVALPHRCVVVAPPRIFHPVFGAVGLPLAVCSSTGFLRTSQCALAGDPISGPKTVVIFPCSGAFPSAVGLADGFRLLQQTPRNHGFSPLSLVLPLDFFFSLGVFSRRGDHFHFTSLQCSLLFLADSGDVAPSPFSGFQALCSYSFGCSSGFILCIAIPPRRQFRLFSVALVPTPLFHPKIVFPTPLRPMLSRVVYFFVLL